MDTLANHGPVTAIDDGCGVILCGSGKVEPIANAFEIILVDRLAGFDFHRHRAAALLDDAVHLMAPGIPPERVPDIEAGVECKLERLCMRGTGC